MAPFVSENSATERVTYSSRHTNRKMGDNMIPIEAYGVPILVIGGKYVNYSGWKDLSMPDSECYCRVILEGTDGHYRKKVYKTNIGKPLEEATSYTEAVFEQIPKARSLLHDLCKLLASCDVNGQGRTSDATRIFGDALLVAHEAQLAMGPGGRWRKIVWEPTDKKIAKPSVDSTKEADQKRQTHNEADRHKRAQQEGNREVTGPSTSTNKREMEGVIHA